MVGSRVTKVNISDIFGLLQGYDVLFENILLGDDYWIG